MPTFNSTELVNDLSHSVNETITTATQLQQIPAALLNKQPAPGKWSIAQVIEHLNSYNRYYLPEIEKTLKEKGNYQPFNPMFKAGLFGNYFTNMMQPKEDGRIANKMQAPKDHRPVDILNTDKVMAEFIKGQEQLLELLAWAAKTDMGKLKVSISISRFIKLKLGDTYRFLIAHQLRHFIQVSNIVTAIDAQPNSIRITA
jgi:hypothetical protein